MALRSRPQTREARLAFEAISIEGGLLSPDWLTRAAQLAAGHQSEADYRVPRGLNLRDEIGRYWRIAQAHWADFKIGRANGGEPQALSERFVQALLREAFGFTTLSTAPPVPLEGRTYPIGFAALGRRVPVVIASAASGLDALSVNFGDGGRRRSAFGLAQEFLNAEPNALWGLTSDGLTLRILRDNASLTRPAWIEVSLERIFLEERYADFAALWLIAHESRFGRAEQPTTQCALEAWREAAREQGTVARGKLRDGVEAALAELGNGFLAHPENDELREALRSNYLTTTGYFNELLRLIYRLIFLLAVEERGFLHPEGASDAARRLYEEGYSLKRLRERAVRRSAHDRHSDLWQALKLVFHGVAVGEPRLALPALSGIFASSQCPHLDSAKLQNSALLSAVFKLSWLREPSGLSRVNWRDMGPEELGSVYESLLELVPRISQGGRAFEFATGGETKGNARKTTGSYYTPDSLVQVLLDRALEPVINQTLAANPSHPVEALLKLSIVDPACGSGHFLLAAARKLAAHVAQLQAQGTPSAAEYRHALRQVVGRCIYGVDLNPMAVELCKVSLWMEAVEPGLPLGFLNSHIQHGNALLGTTPELMAKGIPDNAWECIEGDDKKTASALKKRNKKAAEGQRSFDTSWSTPSDSESAAVSRAIAELESTSDADVGSLERKESKWEAILTSPEYRHQRFVADAWCAAFVWPKTPGAMADAAPTNDVWRQIRDGQGQPPELTKETTDRLAAQYDFLHWHLAFPQVFAKGGFDVVLGNPPWERVKLQEQEFFASRHDEIANAPNAAARKRLIAALPVKDPALWEKWSAASRQAEGQSHFVRQSGRYPLCGRGDVNTYALFAEHNRAVLGPRGRAGFIVPTGIATDDTTKDYFGALVGTSELRALYDFQSGPGLFGEIGHARFKFCLLILGPGQAPADLLFFARSMDELADPARHFSLSPADFATLNPNTKTCPTFRSRRDADLNLAIYRRAGILWRENDPDGNPWGLRFVAMFHMANDSGLFRTRAELESAGWKREGGKYLLDKRAMLPLIEAKMVHHFDHRFGDYADKPADSESTSLPDVPIQKLQDPTYFPTARYWVDNGEVDSMLEGRWEHGWLLGWRDICRSFDERTVIASLIPRVAVGHKFPLLLADRAPNLIAALYANLCSLVLDYAARQKLGGTSLTYFILKQLPVLPPSIYVTQAPWDSSSSLLSWLLPRVLELTYTAWDLAPFAEDLGYECPPFRWEPSRRVLLRAELDAAFFHIYGLSRDDTAYVLDTFPIVQRHDEKEHGEYRTKRIILELHDAMSEAIRTQKPYRSALFSDLKAS
ncbi:Eco57I restriction-modification methylase domain-containing protein [Cystobacter fuscus]|uniref:Eco57I restriction-modification methylase domain-containing protein n=1 Tax=Cystobacter fuscus TaxID=43 RepID=UPI002B289CE4|nr:N-6 DNA methylase [Cystobacter fuscus]